MPRKSYPEPTAEEIATCAYLIYEAEGRLHGRDVAHWLQAEAQLIAARQHDAGVKAPRLSQLRAKQRR